MTQENVLGISNPLKFASEEDAEYFMAGSYLGDFFVSLKVREGRQTEQLFGRKRRKKRGT